MEEFICELCGARPFRHRRALSTHQRTCVGNKRPRQDQMYGIGSTSRAAENLEANEPYECSGSPALQGPNEVHAPSFFNLDEPMDDVLDFEIEQFAQREASRYLYDSTFSLVNWIRTIKKRRRPK